MKKLLFLSSLLILVFLNYSCSSMQTYMYIEPIQEIQSNPDDNKIENQSELIAFIKDIINSKENIFIEAFGRKTFSPLVIHTKLLTHSFYLINLNNEEYYTLSFSGASFGPYSDGFWVLNKETDLSSYRFFTSGNNIWDVRKLFTEKIVDIQQTLKNIINAIEVSANYYYLDHFRKKPNSFNCNSAITETIVFVH